MSYLALYREWRPRTFDEVVEQKQTVYALRQSVINGQIAHAYLFSGTRGTGKTTLAKIFSRAINCIDPQNGNPCNKCEICKGILDGSLMDVVEMDAASNNSVDNIRRICDEVVFMPSQAKFKVYIIDEVHMLSTGAFNALLKTLEEPPAHAVFILATTEPHRLPATILSRCQRYDFRRIPQEGIVARLAEIAESNSIDLSDEALESIASFSDGAMRDAISLLDQARSSIQGRIERDDVLALAGITQDDFMLNVASAVIKGNAASVLSFINELVMSGKDLTRFISDLAQFYRNVLVCQVSDKPQKLIQASDALIGQMMSIAQHTRYQLLIRLIQQLSEMMTDLKWASDARTLMEIGLIRIMSELNPEMIDLSGNDASGIADSIKNDHSETNADTAAAAVVSDTADTTVTTAAVVINTDTDADNDANNDIENDAADSVVNDPVINDSDAELNYPDEINDSFAGLEAPEFFDPENITLDSPEDTLERDNKKTGSTAEIIRSTNPAEINQAELWQKVLDGLQRSGEMIMYLFGKTAAVRQCNDEFHIIFDQKDQVHFEEFSKESSRSKVNRLLRENCEIDLKLIVSIAEDPELAASQACAVVEESWIKQIRETADQFGIPVNVEE